MIQFIRVFQSSVSGHTHTTPTETITPAVVDTFDDDNKNKQNETNTKYHIRSAQKKSRGVRCHNAIMVIFDVNKQIIWLVNFSISLNPLNAVLLLRLWVDSHTHTHTRHSRSMHDDAHISARVMNMIIAPLPHFLARRLPPTPHTPCVCSLLNRCPRLRLYSVLAAAGAANDGPPRCAECAVQTYMHYSCGTYAPALWKYSSI